MWQRKRRNLGTHFHGLYVPGRERPTQPGRGPAPPRGPHRSRIRAWRQPAPCGCLRTPHTRARPLQTRGRTAGAFWARSHTRAWREPSAVGRGSHCVKQNGYTTHAGPTSSRSGATHLKVNTRGSESHQNRHPAGSWAREATVHAKANWSPDVAGCWLNRGSGALGQGPEVCRLQRPSASAAAQEPSLKSPVVQFWPAHKTSGPQFSAPSVSPSLSPPLSQFPAPSVPLPQCPLPQSPLPQFPSQFPPPSVPFPQCPLSQNPLPQFPSLSVPPPSVPPSLSSPLPQFHTTGTSGLLEEPLFLAHQDPQPG